MSRKMDPDLLALKRCVMALETQTRRMRTATLEFLWDRYVTNGDKVPEPDPQAVRPE